MRASAGASGAVDGFDVEEVELGVVGEEVGEDRVVAGPSVEEVVVVVLSVEGVVAGLAVEGVDAAAAADDIVALVSVHLVVAALAGDGVAEEPALEGIVAAAAAERDGLECGARGPEEVVAGAADDVLDVAVDLVGVGAVLVRREE